MAAGKDEMKKGTEEVPVRSGGGLTSLRDEVNRLFDRFTGWRHGAPGRVPDLWPEWAPGRDPFAAFDWPSAWSGDRGLGRADLSETDEGYELQIDLPGMKKDDITVDLSEGLVTVSGERSDEHEDKRKGYYLSERSYGSVRRSFRVPDGVEPKNITAEFNNGVLTLRMPKTEEAQKKFRRISVE